MRTTHVIAAAAIGLLLGLAGPAVADATVSASADATVSAGGTTVSCSASSTQTVATDGSAPTVSEPQAGCV